MKSVKSISRSIALTLLLAAVATGCGGSGDSSGGEVELPDPEDFVSPEAFRSLVQEGSVGDAPGRYRPLNRSYYEELVR